jgi:hypothetical protein
MGGCKKREGNERKRDLCVDELLMEIEREDRKRKERQASNFTCALLVTGHQGGVEDRANIFVASLNLIA